jgi:putative ABC transport system permease protein
MWVPSYVSSFFRNIFRKRRVDQDLDDEVRSYLDLVIDEKRSAGLSDNEARRAALIELQGLEQIKERVRDVRAGTVVEQLCRDVRYGVRVLIKNRSFTTAAVATLALGIGANTAIFTIVDTIVFRPLPYADPERLVKIWGTAPGTQRTDISWADFTDLQSQSGVFERMAADDGMGFTVVYGNGSREMALGAMVTAEWLSTLGVRPLLGRMFVPEEAQRGRDHVVVLTHSYWRRKFASDPNVIGRALSVDGEPFTIIGVLPPNVLRYLSDFLKPLTPSDYPTERGHRDLDVFARLRPDVTLEMARAEVETVGARLAQAYPASNKDRGLTVVPLNKYYVAIDPKTTSGLVLVFGAVAFVLLIACVNVVNLQLARGVMRGRECVIRAALGASRGRLIRQLLIESLLLFVAGGVLGLIVARWSIDSLLTLAVATGYVPEQMVISVDARVFVFSLLVSVIAGLLFGLAPALQGSRVDVNSGLRESAPTLYGGRRATRVRRTLIVSELVLSLVLLVGFGLLIRSFIRVQASASTLAADRILETTAEGGRSFASAVTFWSTVLDSVRGIPGISVAAVTSRPPIHNARQRGIVIPGRPASSSVDEAGDILVSADYFRTLGIALTNGRVFTDEDTATSPPVAVISQSLAQRYFPHESPIGQRLRVMEDDPMTCCSAAGPVAGVWREIVGVVEDVRQANLDDQPAATVYRPYSQIVEHDMYLMVRIESAKDAPRLARDLRARLSLAAPGTEWAEVLPLDRVIAGSESIRLRRFVLILLGSFATLAMVLAAVGLYGVMTYFVAERRREIGIRVVLGATEQGILRDVLVEAIRLAAIALVLGTFAAQILTRLITTMLFGVSGTDVVTYAAVCTLLVTVSLLATYLPARHAARVDPMIALREG